MKTTHLFAGAAVLLCTGAAQSPAPAPQQKTLNLTFGVYQTDKATVMYRSFTPLIDALQEQVAQQLKRPVDIQLTIFRSYDDGIEALCKGTVDFVHIGPASYVTAKLRNPAVQLIAMEHENNEKRVPGVVVVAKDSPITTLAELKGKSFAFGDPNSTVGRWLVQAEMVKAGLRESDFSNIKYMERHDQVADAVAHGDFDAGAVKFSTFQKANAKGALRALLMFDNVTKPVVARQGLDKDVFNAIQKGLYELKDASLFTDLKISGFMSTSDAEYEFVREGMKTAAAFEKRGS